MEFISKPKIENVLLQRNLRVNKNYVSGTLFTDLLTFIFKCDNTDDTSGSGLNSIPGGELQIPHCQVESVDRMNLTPSGTPLYIRCKTFLVLKFIFRKDRDANDFYEAISHLSRPKTIEDLSVLNYRPNDVSCSAVQSSGWHMFDYNIEYSRFGVPNSGWKYSSLNENYKLCPTYPKWLFVPAEAFIMVLVLLYPPSNTRTPTTSPRKLAKRFMTGNYRKRLCHKRQLTMEFISKPKIENVLLQRNLRVNKNYVSGTLFTDLLTFIFKCDNTDDTSGSGLNSIPGGELQIPHCQVESVDRMNDWGRPCGEIKDRDANDFYEAISHLSRPKTIEDLSVLNYRPNDVSCSAVQSSGWHMFDYNIEYSRFGVPNSGWKYSSLNENYKLCPTYPKWLFVPAEATNEIVQGSAKFRSQQRLPALSYLYQPTGAVICRSSQPCVGLNKRSGADEKMLSSIRSANSRESFRYNKLHVIDTRPRVNAMVNRAGGKGYEDVKNYVDVVYRNFPIQNIHVMRESMLKLRNTVESALTTAAWNEGLEESGWLVHLKILLETAKFISRTIHRDGSSVLIHCSDGWDRTAQTSSLSQLILDPYYRTLNGFQILIEKEWLAFGHKFVERCALLNGNPDEASPIFLQFLDAVYQLLYQFPASFEFNDHYLVTLYDMLTGGKFGTFLGNNERSRIGLNERTFSIWGYFWENIENFLNPEYGVSSRQLELGDPGSLLEVSTESRDIVPWSTMYCRYDITRHTSDQGPTAGGK
eukprot:sb/3462362/